MQLKKFAYLVAAALLLVCALSASASVPTRSATTRPVPQIRRALIISVDGLRPDVLLRAYAPRITELYRSGAYTFWAKSTAASITLPTHVSMLTGVTPEQHAIHWNGDLPLAQPVYPRVPTLFELAKARGLTTAMVAGKSKMAIVDKPGSIDHKHFTKSTKSTDEDVIEHAVRILSANRPHVMVVHLPGVDSAGHKYGWATAEQFDAVNNADRCVGQLLDTLYEQNLRDSTLIILTADHGGAGRTHGPDDARSRHVPWIASGPGIRRDFDLTRTPDASVEVYDVFTTVCTLLDIPIKRPVRGRFVEEILADRELLVATYESMQPTTNPAETGP